MDPSATRSIMCAPNSLDVNTILHQATSPKLQDKRLPIPVPSLRNPTKLFVHTAYDSTGSLMSAGKQKGAKSRLLGDLMVEIGGFNKGVAHTSGHGWVGAQILDFLNMSITRGPLVNGEPDQIKGRGLVAAKSLAPEGTPSDAFNAFGVLHRLKDLQIQTTDNALSAPDVPVSHDPFFVEQNLEAWERALLPGPNEAAFIIWNLNEIMDKDWKMVDKVPGDLSSTLRNICELLVAFHSRAVIWLGAYSQKWNMDSRFDVVAARLREQAL